MLYKFKFYGDGKLLTTGVGYDRVPDHTQFGIEGITRIGHEDEGPNYEFDGYQFKTLFYDREATSNLKEARQSVGLTQAELANIAQIKLRTLQEYEQGKKDINQAAAFTVFRLACALTAKSSGRSYQVEDLLEYQKPAAGFPVAL